MFALVRKLSTHARREAGFGMVELLCAMGILSVGILAVFALFESGMIQIKRASTVTTAAALADSEMEKFRAVKYTAIGLVDANSNLVVDGADTTYQGDSAYRAVSSPANGPNSAVTIATTAYQPTRTVTGADGKSYRLDTFITWQSVTGADPDGGGPLLPASGRNVKLVTLVVRDPASLRVWARVASSFDESTGL